MRANREKPLFEFLEPVVLELKLENVSGDPQLVARDALESAEHLTVIIKRQGKAARQWSPYARYCTRGETIALPAGESIYASLFLSAGLNGWDPRTLSTAGQAGGAFEVDDTDVRAVERQLSGALLDDGNEAAETLGHVDYKYYVDRLTECLQRHKGAAVAARCQNELHKTLSARKVKPTVLAATQQRLDALRSRRTTEPSKKKTA